MKQRCWEATRCGREDICPAYPNNGRTCYAVTGTMCRGERQGTFKEKIEKCRSMCGFYKVILRDQDPKLFEEVG